MFFIVFVSLKHDTDCHPSLFLVSLPIEEVESFKIKIRIPPKVDLEHDSLKVKFGKNNESLVKINLYV